MKHSLLLGCLLLLFFVVTTPALANPAGASCIDPTTNQPNDNLCDGNLACISGKCAVDPSLDTAPSPATPTATAPAGGATDGGLKSEAQNFFPLTTLPGLTDIATKNQVSGFLQNLYKICIGLAAVIAVLQLVRAGVMYMGGDSVTETKEARRLIGTALGGLLLVLSPVIVFSIINPQILQLNIGVTNLKSDISTPAPPAPGSPAALSAGICSQYSNFKVANLAVNQTCEQAIGPGYVNLNTANSCCPGAAAGATCCGLDKSYTPPEAAGKYTYTSICIDKTIPSAPCVSINTSKSFALLTQCVSDSNASISASNGRCMIQSGCSAGSAPPLTGQFKTLPLCH